MVVSKVIVQEKSGNQYIYAYIPTEIAKYIGIGKNNPYLEWFPTHGSLVNLRAFPLNEAKKILFQTKKVIINQKQSEDIDLL